MWVFGKATEQEAAKLEGMGWEVNKVDVAKFNGALDPSYDPAKDVDLLNEVEAHDDKLIGVWVDMDLFETFMEWNRQEKEHRV